MALPPQGPVDRRYEENRHSMDSDGTVRVSATGVHSSDARISRHRMDVNLGAVADTTEDAPPHYNSIEAQGLGLIFETGNTSCFISHDLQYV